MNNIHLIKQIHTCKVGPQLSGNIIHLIKQIQLDPAELWPDLVCGKFLLRHHVRRVARVRALLGGGGKRDIRTSVTAGFPLAIVVLDVSSQGQDCMKLLVAVLATCVHQEGARASFCGGERGGRGSSSHWGSGGHSNQIWVFLDGRGSCSHHRRLCLGRLGER